MAMDYSEFSTEDFIVDEKFINWVKQSDAADNAFWEKWLSAHPDKSAQVAEAKAFLLSMSSEKEHLPTAEVEDLLQNIHQDIEGTPKTQQPIYRPLRWLGAAAAIAILVLSLWWRIGDTKQTYTTAFNEMEVIQLPDGSEVIVNANSEISIKKDWQKNANREVWLKGEAYFKVTEEPLQGNRKFVVHTKDVDVEVLGTVFNVNARKTKTTVVLQKGKIQLRTAFQQEKTKNILAVNPGERVIVEKENLAKKTVNTKVYTAWTTQSIVLDNTPFSHLVDILQNNYGFQVEVNDPQLLEKELTGTAPLTDNPQVLLKSMATMFDLTIDQKGKTIIIRKE